MAAFNVVLGCVMALFLILFTISSIARYYIKFTLFTLLSLIFATAPMPLMLFKPFDPKNALSHSWPQGVLRYVSLNVVSQDQDQNSSNPTVIGSSGNVTSPPPL